MAKINKSNISKCILGALAVGGILAVVAIAPNSLQMLKLFGLGKKKYKTRSVYQALRRLKEQKLVEIKETEKETLISITENGKKRLLKYNFDEMAIKRPKHWDKKWRIVSFDIPEKRRVAREALRNKLRDLGFIMLQKSLFILPFPCKDEVDFVTEVFQIQKYVTYFEATSINVENKLKLDFDLI